jgi:hypothetical protein
LHERALALAIDTLLNETDQKGKRDGELRHHWLAGWLGKALGWYDAGEGAGFIAAIVGAFILLFIYRLVAGRRRA